MTDRISIGLLGLGVVGTGVVTAIQEKAEQIAQHLGRPVKIAKALVRDMDAPRPGVPADLPLTTDPSDILDDRGIALVIEVIGGEHPAFEYISKALASGKHVVTANKELMAKHGPELLRIASDNSVRLRFEASVGGGIPIIGPLLDDLAANRISAVNAIINGTTNYILTSMARDGVAYETALVEARQRGYAEPDPTADVDGIDAAFKLAILASLAFKCTVRDVDVYREGIRRLTPADFRYAAELNYVIKLLATARLTDGKVQVRVHPAFLPSDNPLAKVDGVYNAVELEGDLVNWAMFQGPGAGPRPTASAILGDVLAIGRHIVGGGSAAAPITLNTDRPIEPISELRTKYYLRLFAYDRPGVLAQITKVLGDMGVSLASVIQKEAGSTVEVAELVITTHIANEAAVQEAVRRLSELESVDDIANLIRVEERIA